MTKLILLSALAGAALLVAAACGGNSSQSATPESTVTGTPQRSATPSPTPSETGDLDGFRSLAALIDEAISDKDVDLFVDRIVESEVTCSGNDFTGPCLGMAKGTLVKGFRSDGAQSDLFTLYEPREYADALLEWLDSANVDGSDSFGEGAPALLALAVTGGEKTYQAVVSELVPSETINLRQTRILSFQFSEGEWRLTGEMLATVPEAALDWLRGECEDCFDHWEAWEGQSSG